LLFVYDKLLGYEQTLLEFLTPDSATMLYDHWYAAAKEIESKINAESKLLRKANAENTKVSGGLIVLTDGQDTGSKIGSGSNAHFYGNNFFASQPAPALSFGPASQIGQIGQSQHQQQQQQQHQHQQEQVKLPGESDSEQQKRLKKVAEEKYWSSLAPLRDQVIKLGAGGVNVIFAAPKDSALAVGQRCGVLKANTLGFNIDCAGATFESLSANVGKTLAEASTGGAD